MTDPTDPTDPTDENVMADSSDQPGVPVTVPPTDSTNPDEGIEMAFPDPAAVDDEVRARVSARSVAIWGARATGGVIAVAAAAAVAVVALLVTPPTWSVAVPAVTVAPEPAQQTLVCPGPLLRFADASGQNASNATPIGQVPTVGFATASGSLTTAPIGQSDAATGGTSAAPRLAVVTPEGGVAPVVAGMQSVNVSAREANVVGYATTSCGHATRRSWIVGGSTQLGRTSILTLVNPTNVEATVDLELHGESGPINAVGLRGIVVPAGAQRVVSVNGFALDERAPVIGIQSTGGNVAAFLQESIIRTLTPGGVDLSGQQQPSEQLVIPGVLVAGEEALEAINLSAIDEDDTMPTLRLTAPGAAPFTATVALVPVGFTIEDALGHPFVEEAGLTDAHVHAPTAPEPISYEVEMTPGAVTEFPVPGLAAGEYTVVVIADEPVVGAIRASLIGPAGTDFAWYSPAPALGDSAVLVTPQARDVLLAITNPTGVDRTVTLTAPTGDSPLPVPAGTTVLVPVLATTEYALAGMDGLHAAIRSGAPGLIAQSPLLAPAPLAQPVRVHV